VTGEEAFSAGMAREVSPIPPPDRFGEAAGGQGRPQDDFATALREVEEAAREWGIRKDEPEGRFVSALMCAVASVGRISDGAGAEFQTLFREYREAAAHDLSMARELARSGQIALSQARNAQIALQVEQENVVMRMIKETLPLFAEKLKGALVLREKRWNDDVRRRRYAATGLLTLGIFLAGYALSTWQGWGATSALGACLAHPLEANGRIYCDVTRFADHPLGGR
jgi:hypothetical protein